MITYRGDPKTWEPPAGGSAVAIGVFDGVHRGHRRVLAALEDAPASVKIALTFGTHPVQVLASTGAPPLLTTLDDRLLLLGAAGMDRLAVLDFDESMVSTTPEEFVARVLVAGLDVRLVAVGEDFRFGHRARGTAATLVELGRKHGFTVSAVPILRDHGVEIRSTAIRRALRDGDVETAAAWLGRPHRIRGLVVGGEGRGAGIGVPTANLSYPEGLAVPARGVYAVHAEVNGTRHPAVANLGVRPTFGGDREVLEVHLIDADMDLLGKGLAVDFVARLRDEQRFDGVEALVTQIRADIAAARDRLDELAQTP